MGSAGNGVVLCHNDPLLWFCILRDSRIRAEVKWWISFARNLHLWFCVFVEGEGMHFLLLDAWQTSVFNCILTKNIVRTKKQFSLHLHTCVYKHRATPFIHQLLMKEESTSRLLRTKGDRKNTKKKMFTTSLVSSHSFLCSSNTQERQIRSCTLFIWVNSTQLNQERQLFLINLSAFMSHIPNTGFIGSGRSCQWRLDS